MNSLEIVETLLVKCRAIPQNPYSVKKKALNEIEIFRRDFMAFLKANSLEFHEYLFEYEKTSFYPDKEIKFLYEEGSLKDFRIYEWKNEIKQLERILMNIKAQLDMKTNVSSNEYLALQKAQKIRLKRWALFWFLTASTLVLLPLNWYFFAEAVDWENANILNPFTYIDQDKFARGELVIGFWVAINGYFGTKFRTWWERFSKWYFQKFRVK